MCVYFAGKVLFKMSSTSIFSLKSRLSQQLNVESNTGFDGEMNPGADINKQLLMRCLTKHNLILTPSRGHLHSLKNRVNSENNLIS